MTPKGLKESLADHLRDGHSNFTVARKAQRFVRNCGGDQEKRIEKYWRDQERWAHLHYKRDNPAWQPDYWKTYDRLGQVEEAVEFRFFNPEYFWWGPKVSLFSSIHSNTTVGNLGFARGTEVTISHTFIISFLTGFLI